MLTHAPLPGWRHWLRAVFHAPASDDVLGEPWRGRGDAAGWLSRSSWSLALIALWRKELSGKEAVSVWLPDYFCDQSLVPLRRAGASVWFYRVDDGMTPDLPACKARSLSDRPDVFVLTHYLGKPSPAGAVRDFCGRLGAWLVEDAVHALRPVSGIGTAGDFVMYSPHKHLPIPEGAVLVARSEGPSRLGAAALEQLGSPSSWHARLELLAGELGCRREADAARTAVWVAKRIAQAAGVDSARGASPFEEGEHSQEPSLVGPRMGLVARRMLTGMVPDIGLAARRRQRRQLLWDHILSSDLADGGLRTAERPEGRSWIPYLSAYTGPQESVALAYGRWARAGWPATTWPDLPEEVRKDRQNHDSAWRLRHTRVYLPVHESLVVESIVRRRRPAAGRARLPALNLVWDGCDRERWEDHLAAAERSSLLQGWAYGNAKAAEEGWRVTRGVFHRDSEPLALVQVLRKRVGGMIQVLRVNRGPLLLRELDDGELRSMWQGIAALGDARRARMLSIAPELQLTGANLALLCELGLRQTTPGATESVWMDLRLETDVLRKRLDAKWRNMLAFGEKAGLTLDASADDEAFEWMITRYEELMRARDFVGPSVGLVRALRRHAGRRERLLVLRATHEGDYVAGICLAIHGSSATYLLGWNGDAGRNLKANQFLLWQAMVHLKQAGQRWLDLGGISEERTPGVTAFKLGLNGERYELVGEYWKW